MLRALDETRIDGVATTIPADVAILAHPDFVAATHSTRWVEDAPRPLGSPPRRRRSARGRREAARQVLREVTAEVDGRRYRVKMWVRPT